MGIYIGGGQFVHAPQTGDVVKITPLSAFGSSYVGARQACSRGQPLAGIGVVDFSRVLAGPLVAMTLGDLGADVIKVESPLGDDTRRWKPPQDALGRAAYHHAANRNKRSIVSTCKAEGDLELARRLCERADVVVVELPAGHARSLRARL